MATAIVTGGSRGLGLALVRSLAGDGWRVITDARDGHALRHATSALAGVVAVPGDVSDPEHRRALVAAAGERIDALVHNASLLGPSPQPALADYPAGVLERVYAVNVLAPLALTRRALPRMLPGAAIVAITSDAAREPYPGWGGYGSSKAALEQAISILAAERADLRVYTADPGDLRTRMHAEAYPGEDISDRPPPEVAVPGLRRLLGGDLASGRYTLRQVGTRA